MERVNKINSRNFETSYYDEEEIPQINRLPSPALEML